MPSSRCFVLPGILVASASGCVDDPPSPDISSLSIAMRWDDSDRRSIDISIANPDIPCTEVEGGFLGESAVECQSAPWTLTVDGIEVHTSPVTCWSAHDGLFGHVPKRCEGGAALAILREPASEDVEIVAATDTQEKRFVLRGVGTTRRFVQERAYQGGEPGVIRVDDLELVGDSYRALFLQSGVTTVRDFASREGTSNRLRLSPSNIVDGTYDVRVLARARQGGATIAIPIDGSLTIGP